MVHQVAAFGFDQAAVAYERGRPSYPVAAVDWLMERTGMTAPWVVVDLAAGTGKLTRLLLTTGAKVIAVEPVAGMRRVLGSRVPGVEVVAGTAENIPLPGGSVDLVSVGQAFHWFDVPAALAEIHRALRQEGWLALVWNRRLLDEPIHREISAIVDPTGVRRRVTTSKRPRAGRCSTARCSSKPMRAVSTTFNTSTRTRSSTVSCPPASSPPSPTSNEPTSNGLSANWLNGAKARSHCPTPPTCRCSDASS